MKEKSQKLGENMKEKIAVITGVSSGIGESLAKKFKKEGFFVIGISRKSPAENCVDNWICSDLTKKEDVDNLIKVINENYEKIDVLVNNAGRGHYETWEKSSFADIKSMFDLNVFAIIKLTTGLLENLKKTQGTIINISSVAAVLPVACMGAYCASKAAVTAFSSSLRIELIPHKINVLDVKPGRIHTGFSSRVSGNKKAPKTPGVENAGPEKMVKDIFKYYQKGKSELVFPAWYKFLFIFSKFFKKLYANENLKRWNLK